MLGVWNPLKLSCMHGFLVYVHALVSIQVLHKLCRQTSAFPVMGQIASKTMGCSSIGGSLPPTVGVVLMSSIQQSRVTGPAKTFNFKLTWWFLPGILVQAVLAVAVMKHALRLPRPELSSILGQICQVRCKLQDRSGHCGKGSEHSHFCKHVCDVQVKPGKEFTK